MERLPAAPALSALPGTATVASAERKAASLVDSVLISDFASVKDALVSLTFDCRLAHFVSLRSNCLRTSSPFLTRDVCAASSALSSFISLVAAGRTLCQHTSRIHVGNE